MAGRAVSIEFVGRAAEIERANATLDAAATGSGASHLLIAGEAGVGKTRFTAEIERLATERDFRILRGACVAIGPVGLPYAPFAAALRELVRDADSTTLATVGAGDVAALGHLAPGLVTALASPGAEATGVRSTSTDAQLFEALLDLLVRLAVARPLLVVVEDVHWADPATRAAITFLASNLADARIVLALTFRSDEIDRRHPLMGWLAELGRTGRFERIELGRFDRAETARLVALIRGSEPDRQELDRLHERTDGNAFFLEELLLAGATGLGSGGLPPTLHATLIARIAATSEPAHRVLRVAAVAGRRVEHDLLGAVAGLPQSELTDGLRAAVDSQLLVLDTAGRDRSDGYAFRHALLQEAVYDDLLPGERRSIHRAYAAELESRQPGSGVQGAAHWAELAHHWSAAHDDTRAADAALAAGDAAFATFAFVAAQRQYECVLEFWDSVPDPEARLGLDRVELLERAANSAEVAGDYHRMTEFLREAIAMQDSARDPTRAALLRARLGRAHWLDDGAEPALTAFAEAMSLLPPGDPSLARARVLAGYGQLLMLIDRFDEGIAACEEAAVLARAAGDQQVEAHALNSAGVCLAVLGRCQEGMAALERSLMIARELGSAEDVGRGLVNLTDVLRLCAGDRAAMTVVAQGVEEIDRLGMSRSYGPVILENGALLAYLLGDWDEAASLGAEAKRRSRPGLSARLYHEARTIELAVSRGVAGVADRLDRFREDLVGQTVEGQYHGHYILARVDHERWAGRPESALETVDQGLGWLRTSGFPRYLGRIHGTGAAAAADLAERARALRDDVSTRAAIERVHRHVDAIRAIVAARGDEPAGRNELEAVLARAEADLARARGETAEEPWSRSIAAWERAEQPYEVALARRFAAEAALARADAPAAAAHLRASHRFATTRGARPLAVAVESLARRGRIDLVEPALPEPAGAVAAGSAPPSSSADEAISRLGLTRREREVLACLAEGWTNRQIADHLFISENTAGVHVSNILGKVGAATRTEAAAIAHRLGLTGVP